MPSERERGEKREIGLKLKKTQIEKGERKIIASEKGRMKREKGRELERREKENSTNRTKQEIIYFWGRVKNKRT